MLKSLTSADGASLRVNFLGSTHQHRDNGRERDGSALKMAL